MIIIQELETFDILDSTLLRNSKTLHSIHGGISIAIEEFMLEPAISADSRSSTGAMAFEENSLQGMGDLFSTSSSQSIDVV